ncbi:MAG TPA: sulfite exporter TauE/SafE family protein [Burkholderiaceae bacterium]|nr:sulfite exporter TauE/SafE family protein [Burkholderiaceae bacterium]
MLTTSALLLGLAGGPHCALMCGALQAGVARRPSPAATRRALVSLHVGRLIGYSAAGALVAASVSALSRIGAASPVLTPVWTMLQVAALAFGLVLMATGMVPAWLSRLKWRRAPAHAPGTVQFLPRASNLKAAGAGACWAAIPCGLLQSALIVAALADTAAQGAGVMGAFAVGTAVSLLIVSSAWSRLAVFGPRLARTTLSVRLAGGLLAASSAFALSRGLGAALQGALCL